MLQCKDCEFFHRSETGQISLTCDPFSTIKEPQCLQKWQLLKVNQMVANYQLMLDYYRKLAPIQEKMFNYVEKELEDINESDKWKVDEDDDEPQEDWTPPGEEF